MKRKEILSFIFLAEKYNGKEDSDILVDITYNPISGEIVNGNFLYSIGENKNIIPIARIWEIFLSQVKGGTKNEYLKNINKLLQRYPFSKDILLQLRYINPETKELEYLE